MSRSSESICFAGLFELFDRTQALAQSDTGLHQLGASTQQALDLCVALGRAAPRAQRWLFMAQVAQQQARIVGIGLGALADTVAVAAEPVAVDQVDRVSGLVGGIEQIQVIGVGRLDGQRDRNAG